MSDRSFKPIRSLTGRVRRPGVRRPPAAPGASLAVERIGDRVSMVDSAVYVAGDRVDSPTTLADTYRSLRDHDDAIAWIGLYRPDHHELGSLADEFDLHELAVEDAIVAHQRPKLERYGDTLFVVLARRATTTTREEVDFGEVHLFVGPDFVITVRHSESPDLSAVRRRLESNPDLLALGPEAILYAILDRSSTATRRSSPASATTSTRSRPRSSAATRRCRGASTSSPAR